MSVRSRALSRAASIAAVALVTALGVGLPAAADAEEPPPAIAPIASFTNATPSTAMGLTWDGSSYWSISGGTSGGQRLAQYDANGDLVTTYAPGLDFRSITAAPDGTVYARSYNSSIVYKMIEPGVFESFTTLTGSSIDSQGSVIVNAQGDGFISFSHGTVTQWGLDGSVLGTLELDGYGSEAGEDSGTQTSRIAQAAGFLVTGNTSTGVYSAWDASGNREQKFTIAGVSPNDFNVMFSISGFGATVAVSTSVGTLHLVPLRDVRTSATSTIVAGTDSIATATVVDPAVATDGAQVDFSLYGDDDATCTGTPVATSTGTIADGIATSTPVTLKEAGTYRWVATYADLQSPCMQAPVTVQAGELAGLQLTPATASIGAGESQDFTATGADAYGNAVEIDGDVTYTIDNGTCVDGACSGEAGTHTVTASFGGVTGTATLTIAVAAPTIATDPADVTVATGGDARFTIEPAGGTAEVAWQSSPDGEEWSNVPGADASTLTVEAVDMSLDGTQYRAVLTNASGTAVSEAATLSVTPAAIALTDDGGTTLVSGAMVTVGDSLEVTVRDAAPGATFTVEFHSDPVTLGTITANADGLGSLAFEVPDVAAGTHELVVLNERGTVASVSLEVAAAPAADDDASAPSDEDAGDVQASAPEEVAASIDELSGTGPEVAATTVAAISALMLGAALIVAVHRRRSARA